ncbi:MAG: ribonuclease H-like domain-containing protein [Clostridia bacterium]|nr:ribonuclease H-like domain-containing protein [Clostridia bacterium]
MRYNTYTKGLKCRVFDIETTGLYPGRDRIISASFIDPDGSNLTQYFSESSASEHLTVSSILSEFSDCDVIITYNGQSFDVPFVLTRARKYGIAEELPAFFNADVYRWLKSYWPLAETAPSLSQKSVEKMLGIGASRTDLINGGECIQLYSEYINLDNEKAKDLILLHNGDDVRQLARITQALSFLPYDKISFDKGFMLKLSSSSLFGETTHKIITTGLKLSDNVLSVCAKSYPACQPCAFYEDEMELQCSGSGEVSLKINVKSSGALRFADLKGLKVPEDELQCRQHIKSGYLILQTEDGVNFGACCELAKILLRRLV